MSKPQSIWFQLNPEQRKDEIIIRRRNNQSFAQIAEDLLGSAKNKSTIWSWAKRNLEGAEIYPRMAAMPSEPYRSFSEAEQWIMFDYVTSLFPRLDALSEHLLVEIDRILNDQQKRFRQTAGFLDELENRVIEAIRRNTASLSTRVTMATVSSASLSPPRVSTLGAPPPPPPPPGVPLPAQAVLTPGTIQELRTDFENMTMEEITALPQDFLESLSPVDRGQVQARVKELRMIEKMSPEERAEYLQKKQEEKERSEAQEGLGTSLTSMLDDSDSLFARMRRAADDSQVSGTGTFGKFMTEYIYFYCFSCGKMNRSEDEDVPECEYCGASPDLLVPDDVKSDYDYWECLTMKRKEIVDLSYSRGKQIAIRSRWKSPKGEMTNPLDCGLDDRREITTAVEIKADPDKQFSHYLTLLRLYTQLPLKGDLTPHIVNLNDAIQNFPDVASIEVGVLLAETILDKILLLLKWIDSQKIIKDHPQAIDLNKQIENLQKDIQLLQDKESPQELQKSSDIGQIGNKLDQLLNKFTAILTQLESELLMPSKWKCSHCDEIFGIKNRFNVPDHCQSCGKIITKLEPVK